MSTKIHVEAPSDEGASLTLVQEGIETALQVARAGVWEVNLADLSSNFSEGYYQLLGHDPDVGRRDPDFWMRHVHPDDRQRVIDGFLEYIRDPVGLYELEYRLHHLGGHWLWVMVRGRVVARDSDGTALRAMGFIIDVSERRAAVDELRQNEERLRMALGSIRGMIYEVDLLSHRMIQKGIEQLAGRSFAEDQDSLDEWAKSIHPEDREWVVRVIRAHRASGAHFEQTYRVIHADGRTIHVWHRGSYQRDRNGQLVRAFGVVEDVTAERELRADLRRTERALRESQQVLNAVTDSSWVHLTMFDRERRCIFANRPMTGGPEKLVGMRLEEMMPGARVADAVKIFEQVISTGQRAEITDQLQGPDGTPLFYHALLCPVLREGAVIGVVANMTDVTETRRQQDEKKLQANIIDRMREGVMLLDRQAQIIFTNPAFDVMFGYSAGELIGRSARLLSARDEVAFKQLVVEVLSSVDERRESVFDLEGLCRDGSTRTLQCIFTAAVIGDTRCVIGVMSDVSEHKRLQRELLQVESRVQHQVGSDLHDGVGQQLAGIAMMLKSLVRRLGNSDSRDLRSDVQQIVDLVNEALQNTRSLARGLAPVHSDREGLFVGFEELVQNAMDRYQVKVRLDLDLPAEMRIGADTASNLYRIAQEGVLNAARHSKASQISVKLGVAEGMAELLIVDDGSGFDPQNVTRGGMGLRVMRFRAQMLGGYFSVESRPGSGTTLHCRCPLLPEREAA